MHQHSQELTNIRLVPKIELLLKNLPWKMIGFPLTKRSNKDSKGPVALRPTSWKLKLIDSHLETLLLQSRSLKLDQADYDNFKQCSTRLSNTDILNIIWNDVVTISDPIKVNHDLARFPHDEPCNSDRSLGILISFFAHELKLKRKQTVMNFF